MRVNVPEEMIDDFQRAMSRQEALEERRALARADVEAALVRPDFRTAQLDSAVRRWGYIA